MSETLECVFMWSVVGMTLSATFLFTVLGLFLISDMRKS